MQTIRDSLAPIHREGYKFGFIFGVVTIVLFFLWGPLGWIGLFLTGWCLYFFRDPKRITPIREGLVVSPADGMIKSIEMAVPPPELEMGSQKRLRIAVFMNVFDVHVNRVPMNGEITALHYREGKFVNASLDKASIDNERQSVKLTSDEGHDIAFVQIAGLVARRILCHLFVGKHVKAGERFGMIRFGSRVDVYLDADTVPMVVVGQRAIAGETILSDFRALEPAREGEVR